MSIRTKKNTIAITTTLSVITAITALLGTGTMEEIIKDVFSPLPQPTAVAGGSDMVYERDDIYLTGKNSYSDNGIIKNYFWDYLKGPHLKMATIENKDAIVTAPPVTADSEITFQLKVIDEKNKQNSAIHSVKVMNIKNPPKAVVQTNYTVTEGQNLFIDGSNSTGPNPDSKLIYEWKQLSGPQDLNIIYHNTSTPIVIIPDIETDTYAQLLFTVFEKNTNKMGIEFVNIYITNKDNLVPATHTMSNAFPQFISHEALFSRGAFHKISNGNYDEMNFGGQKSFIHHTKMNGSSWQLNMTIIPDEMTVLYDAEVAKNSDESWKLIPESKGPADGMTLYAYTTDFASSDEKISEKNHKLFEKNGFIFNERDWKNVEITTYVRINSLSDDN